MDGWTLKRSEGPRARNGLPGVVEESFEEVVVLVGHESINVAICERVNTLSEAAPEACGLAKQALGAAYRLVVLGVINVSFSGANAPGGGLCSKILVYKLCIFAK